MPNVSANWKLPCLALLLAAQACSVADSFTPADKHPVAAPGVVPEPPSAPKEASVGQLSTAQLVRRLALDLNLRLPAASDSALLTADANRSAQIVAGYTADKAIGRALATLHPRIWRLTSSTLPDLDRFAAAGEPSLSALSAGERQQIVDEPSLLVRYVLEKQLPWSSVYTLTNAVATSRLLQIWQAPDLGSAGSGDDLHSFAPMQQSAAVGLLADPGFLANFSALQDPLAQRRGSQIYSRLLCIQQAPAEVHSFKKLTSAESAGDLRSLALSKQECAGCHAPSASFGGALAGFAQGQTFTAWLTAPPETTSSGVYGQQAFSGAGELAALLATDPRQERCELQRLLETLYQRPLADSDRGTLAAAVEAFHGEGGSLAAAARVLASADTYRTAPLPPSFKGAQKRSQSGVKVLTKAQWRALYTTLLPQNNLLFTDDLDPGHDEAFSGTDAVPSGGYWHAVDRLSRQAATQIVASELAQGVLARQRQVLTEWPDGSGSGGGGDTVTLQLQTLWLKITGTQLTAKDQTMTELTDLWTQLAPVVGDEATREAWRVMLTALLSHPDLVAY